MPKVNRESLRSQFSEAKQSANELIAQGKVSPEIKALITTLLTLMELVMAVFLEKTTKKTNSNSGIPPSVTHKPENDDHGTGKGSKGKGPTTDQNTFSNSRTTERIDRIPVSHCDCCGESLQDEEAHSVERRTTIDLYFEKVVEHQEIETKTCPKCKTTTTSRFSPSFQHIKQFGLGLQAFIVNLLCAQMISLKRVQQMVAALIGDQISESTLLKYLRKVHFTLDRWEEQVISILLQSKTMHVDETSMRVDGKNHWVHVCSSGPFTIKKLHKKRGRVAMDEHDILPRYGGVIIHDCWASYFKFESCDHGLCGAHLVRELAFIIESNNYAWASRMKKLLLLMCKMVASQKEKRLSDKRYQRFLRLYRFILAEGREEMPPHPTSSTKKRGRVAKTDAENLLERLEKHETSVLLFARHEHVPFTNNQAERALRMGKVKQKVSGCFRTFEYAQVYVRISSYLQTMTALGYNPLKSIQMALTGELYSPETAIFGAASTIKGKSDVVMECA